MFIENEEESIKEVDKSNNITFRNKENFFHRLNGPAIIYSDGTKYWMKNGEYHREDGPAMEYVDGNKFWYKNGKRHRLNGPAIERINGTKEYWIEGKEYSFEKYLENIIKLELEYNTKLCL